MKINEYMRDAIESIRETSTTLDEMFDNNNDHVELSIADIALFENVLHRISLSMYHLQRCERLNE